ncbi:unnamed protein product [Strongylus vulgaris]|uniref:Ketoreductase (KR) domain-containing protein n=1 Tax=Strongylus vulgaris TaxID=40348 RepID=A0A3P7JVG9_STRVU|nr:unnamed protein product [Strongylus vulgaris]
MKETIDETLKKFGRLDVLVRVRALLVIFSKLVNNAGGSSPDSTLEGNELDGDLSKFEYAWELNTRSAQRQLFSILRLCQLAFPHLVKTKGEVVNVSSIAGKPNGCAAQDQLTRNLAIYYITKGVRVNIEGFYLLVLLIFSETMLFSPGCISTNIWKGHGFTDEMVKKVKALASKHRLIPYQCIGKSEDVAEAILSNYIVGHQLVIDGGASLQMPLIAESPEILGEVLGMAAPKE